MSVLKRLVCRACVAQACVGEFEEMTLGVIGPRACTICGQATGASELRQPFDETWSRIRQAVLHRRVRVACNARDGSVLDDVVDPVFDVADVMEALRTFVTRSGLGDQGRGTIILADEHLFGIATGVAFAVGTNVLVEPVRRGPDGLDLDDLRSRLRPHAFGQGREVLVCVSVELDDPTDLDGVAAWVVDDCGGHTFFDCSRAGLGAGVDMNPMDRLHAAVVVEVATPWRHVNDEPCGERRKVGHAWKHGVLVRAADPPAPLALVVAAMALSSEEWARRPRRPVRIDGADSSACK